MAKAQTGGSFEKSTYKGDAVMVIGLHKRDALQRPSDTRGRWAGRREGTRSGLGVAELQARAYDLAMC